MKKFFPILFLVLFLASACGTQNTPDSQDTTQSAANVPVIENSVTIWVCTSEILYNFKNGKTTIDTNTYNQNGDYVLLTSFQDGKELGRNVYEYDVQGRLIKSTYSFSGIVSSVYECQYEEDRDIIVQAYYDEGKETRRSVTISSSDGLWYESASYKNGSEFFRTTLKYNEIGKCIEQVRYENNVKSVTTYTYDDRGNNTLTVCSKDGVEAYRYIKTYDENNFIIEHRTVRGEEEQHTTYVYDANGNTLECIAYTTDTEFEKISYTYDENGNVLERISSDQTESPDTTSIDRYEYDQNGNMVLHHQIYCGSDWGTGYFVYDEHNNMIQSEWVGADGVVKDKIVYQYGANSNLIKRETFAKGMPEETIEKTWIEITVSEEKAEELFRNNGVNGDYRFEAEFLQKIEEAGITCPLDS